MKKILAFFLPLLLMSKTIVVDSNFIANTRFGVIGSICENDGDYNTSTISDALNNANWGDVIKICKGTYREAGLDINTGNLTIENGSNADKISDIVINGNGSYFFKVKTYANAITIKNMTLKNTNGQIEGIIFSDGGENMLLENLNINTSGSSIEEDGNFKSLNLKELNLSSKKQYGIYITGSCYGESNFSDINITSDKSGVYVGDQFKSYNMKNMDVNSTKQYGLYFGDSSYGDSNFSDINITSNYDGFYFKKGWSGSIYFGNIDINSSKNGIKVDNDGNDFNVIAAKNVKIYAPNGLGFYFTVGSYGDNNFTEINDSSYKEGIYYSKGFSGVMRVSHSLFDTNWSGIKVDDNGNTFKSIIVNDVNISSSEKFGFDFEVSSYGEDNFTNVNINSNYDCVDFAQGWSKNNAFKKFNCISANGNGIYSGDDIGGIYALNSSLKVYENALYIDGKINNEFELENFDFNALNGSGVYINKDLNPDFNISDGNITAENGLYFNGDLNGNGGFKNLKIYADNGTGIAFVSGGSGNKNITIYDVNITAAVGINATDSFNDFSMGHSFILASYVGLDINNTISDTEITSSHIYGGKTNALLYRDNEYNTIKITKSCFANGNNVNNTIRLDVNNTSSSSSITKNCIYGLGGVELLGYADGNDSGSVFDSNYWYKDVNGTYEYNNIDDENALSSCPNSCDFLPVMNYRMDKCKWHEGVKGDVWDYSGNDYNGTAENGANTVSAAAAGGGLCRVGYFDGKDDYVQIDKVDPNPIGKYGVSYSAWIKIADPDHYSSSNGGLENIFTHQGWGNAMRYTEHGYYYNGKDESNRILFQLYINELGTTQLLFSNTEINDTDWHNVVCTYDGKYMKIYIDGVLDASAKVKGTVYSHYDYKSRIGAEYDDSNGNPKYTFYGYIDELKVWKRGLGKNFVYYMYDNEKNNKNWDGNVKQCIACTWLGCFDARDTWREWNNTLISTKIVNKEFNLTIAAYTNDKKSLKDFNGTVCVKLIDANDTNLTPWVKLDAFLNDINETNWTTIKVNRADKIAKVWIQWKADVNESCPVSSEYNATISTTNNTANGDFYLNSGAAGEFNETNSSDSFAIRPWRFEIVNIPKVIRAGREFNLTIRAVGWDNKPAKDYNETLHIRGISPDLEYNETKSWCILADLNKTAGGKFKDGETNVTLRYPEVGDLNFTIKEVNGSEFAKIDVNDTNITDHPIGRFVEQNTTFIKIQVDHFKLNAGLSNHNNINNFTYLNKDLNISAPLELNITAQNEQNQTTENYNEKCYAKNIDLNFTFNYLYHNKEINVTKLRYYFTDVNGTKSAVKSIGLKDVLQIFYKDTNFTTEHNGTTYLKLFINYDRNFSVPSNPFEINISEINITDGNISDKNLFSSGSAKFVYGNVITKDVVTSANDFNVSFNYIMYDENESDTLKPNTKELLINWYKNKWHRNADGNVSDEELVVSKDYNVSNRLSNTDVEVKVLKNADGEIVLNVKRNNDNVKFAVIHLLSPNLKWLWYSRFNRVYDVDEDSTCLNHFCFSITWENIPRISQTVSSGNFQGTEANITEINTTSTGVKVFR